MLSRSGHRLDSRRLSSLGLAGLYAFATLMAQVAHEHAHEHTPPKALQACDAPGAHWGSHTDSPDLSAASEICPACLVRAQTARADLPPPMRLETRGTLRGDPRPVRIDHAPILLTSLSRRGPPRATHDHS